MLRCVIKSRMSRAEKLRCNADIWIFQIKMIRGTEFPKKWLAIAAAPEQSRSYPVLHWLYNTHLILFYYFRFQFLLC